MKKTIVEKMTDKVRLCCFASALVVGSLNLWADHVVTYRVGDLEYRYDRDAPNQGATVVRAYMPSKNLVIPAKELLPLGSVCECGAVHLETDPGKFVDIPVVEVGAEVFWREDLHEVHILGTLKRIGNRAFGQNDSLSRVIISGGVDEVGVEAFYQCPSLKQIEFPNDGPRIIGSHAFSGAGLERFDFGARVESVGDNAFSGTELTAVTVRADIRWGAGVFAATPMKNVTFEGDFTEITEEMFFHCHELEKIAWPPTLKHIGDLAFAHCDNLTTVDFSATSLETIGQAAFASCGKIQDPMIFPETLKQLGPCAFYPAGPWVENYGDMAKQPPVVRFLGPPPEMDEYVFNSGSVYFLYGKYADAYREEWEEAIATYGDINETQGEWHGLNMLPLLVRPIGYQCLKDGTQELNVGWSVFEEGDDLDKRNWRELGNKRFYVWRSSGNDYTDARRVTLLTEEPISGTNYIDKTFGEISGTQPVRYWVELESTAGRRPTERAAFCDTRRRFGLAIGLSEYGPDVKENPLGGFLVDTGIFASLIESSYDGCQIDRIYNADATVSKISQGIRNLPFDVVGKKRVLPGDIVFLWIATHGGQNGVVAAYDGYYGNSASTISADGTCVRNNLREDLSWVGENPGVRVVCLFPFCHSQQMWTGLGTFPNSAFIGATRRQDVSRLGRTETQFGNYFLQYGVAEGFANLATISGSPFDDLGSDGFDIPSSVGAGPNKSAITLDEIGRYAKSLAYGLSSKCRARVVIEREEILSTIIIGKNTTPPKGDAPNLVYAVAEQGDSGAIKLYYQVADSVRDVLIWHRKVGTGKWQWSSHSSFASDREEFREGRWIDWHRYFRCVTFGSQSKAERDYRGVIGPDEEYEFAVQQVNEYGYGPAYVVQKCRTGADLPMVAREVFEREFREMREYLGTLGEEGRRVCISITPEGDFWTIGMSLDDNGVPVEYIGRAARENISEAGVMKVSVRRVMKNSNSVALYRAQTEETPWPLSVNLDVSLDGVKGLVGDDALFCDLVCDASEIQNVSVPGDSYGPFVPGEKVELKFLDGAAWKVTGLPTGLKWDAKLPGVTGVPTKPGTNTVTFTWTDKSVKPNVEHKASSTFIVGPLPVLSVRTAGEGTGKVTGAGAYAANKKVTLKATADTKDAAAKGKNPATVKSVFAGWYDAAGGLVAQTPSLSYVMPPYDVALEARFIPASNDWATVDCVTEAGSVWVVTNETKVVLAPISVAAAGGSLPTVKVAGLPSGLKFTTKDIMKKNPKTEVDIPANTIYGTPTKGGVYNATVTVTTAGKASVVRAIKFIIRTASDYVVDADWDPVQGKVTGAGVYQAGKKVTLKATANKGYVFSGWYEGDADGGQGLAALPADGLVSRLASYVLTMPTNDVAFTAKFVTAEEDRASIGATVADFAFGAAAEDGGSTGNATNVMAGVYLAWPVAASALSQPTVKVAGLPSGLKFTAKPITSKVTSGTGSSRVTTVVTNVPANTIYGVPTAASKTDKKGNVTPSKVKVTVTTAGKSKAVYEIVLTVYPLPALAAGEFSGLALTKIWKDGVVTTTRWGSASLTVGSAGKMSGKMIVNGTNCTFTAASYDSFRKGKTEDDWQATAICSLKIGKQVVPMGLTVVAGGASVEEDDLTVDFFRNSWKDKGAEPVPEEYQGTYSVKLASDRFRTGYLSLTVDKKGAVKVAGKAPDGTELSGAATLVPAVDPDGAAYYFADVFCAPSAYKGGYVAGTVNFLADRTLSGYVEWRSYNPQSTGDYEKGGFDRALDCSGAKYNKTASLKDGFDTLMLSALGVGEELFIIVDQTGKKFVVVDKGEAKLTFSFTQSTGIWKGSYLMWPDPSSTKSVNVSFEGILVSGEGNLQGFGTYDATSSYPVYNKKGEQTGKKSYKYTESVPVSFDRE